MIDWESSSIQARWSGLAQRLSEVGLLSSQGWGWGVRELPSRAPSGIRRLQWVHAWKAGAPSGPKSATGGCRQFWRHEWTDLAVPPRPDNRQLVLAIYVMLTLVLWPSAASHQHQWKTVLAAQSAAISRRHGLGCWAILSALWPCVPQMQHCEDIKAQALVTVGAMTLALGRLGLVVLSGMIGQQVFCQSPALPKPSSMV